MEHRLDNRTVSEGEDGLMRRAGAKPWFGIFLIANGLAFCRTDDQDLFGLFDWTDIDAWPCSSPCEEAIQGLERDSAAG